MSGSKTQVDYNLVNRKWNKCVKNVAAYIAFCSMESDHLVLTVRIKLSLGMSKSQPRKKQYDWSALQNKDIYVIYYIAVGNRFAALFDVSDDVTQSYGKLIQANEEASEGLIPKKTKRRRKKLADVPTVRTARKELQSAYVDYQLHPCDENQRREKEPTRKLMIIV